MNCFHLQIHVLLKVYVIAKSQVHMHMFIVLLPFASHMLMNELPYHIVGADDSVFLQIHVFLKKKRIG